MRPFMTQAMLDGMDHFWRMRSHLDMASLPAERRALVLPFIRAWADSVADMPVPPCSRPASSFTPRA